MGRRDGRRERADERVPDTGRPCSLDHLIALPGRADRTGDDDLEPRQQLVRAVGGHDARVDARARESRDLLVGRRARPEGSELDVPAAGERRRERTRAGRGPLAPSSGVLITVWVVPRTTVVIRSIVRVATDVVLAVPAAGEAYRCDGPRREREHRDGRGDRAPAG